MATVSPPGAPSVGPPTPPRRPVVRGGSRVPMARIVAVGALALVVLIVAYLVFSGGGGGEYQLIFENAGQLVRGDQVEVGGVPVGTVKNITLTNNYKARVTVHIEPSLTPLHVGTTAEIRVVSLFGVANRYIALSPGPNNARALPNGATLHENSTQGVVDLDQVFGTFNARTRKALQNVILGSAEQYEGAGVDLNTATEYFPPALAAGDHFFSQLTRNEKTYTAFLVEASKALTTIAAHKSSLTGLIANTDATFAALAPEQANLTKGLEEIPRALHEGNQTFTELPPALAALTKLVNVSKPATKNLAPFFAQLNSLLVAATPVLENLNVAISKPGPNNDLTDAALELPVLAKALESAAPHINPALQEAVPVTAYFGPYTPDFEGLFRNFGAGAAYYDANGHYARITPDFADFKLGENNTLTPVTPQQGLEGLKSHQLRRCPGAATQPAADGSSPFTDNGLLSCDPTQTP
jgi:phospholipid/cholesterol/gamma-HCH transport system substrate-binding protein